MSWEGSNFAPAFGNDPAGDGGRKFSGNFFGLKFGRLGERL